MSNKENTIRRAQTIQPFGVGSIITMDGESFVVNDIPDWKHPKQAIKYERLNRALGNKILLSFSSFDNNEESITVTRFPEWYHCSKCEKLRKISSSDKLLREYGKPLCNNNKCNNKAKLSPMRFVAYCDNGHLTDINWWLLAHSNQQLSETGNCNHQDNIFFESTGKGGGDFDQMFVNCRGCGADKVSLKNIAQNVTGNFVNARPGQSCCGTHPWMVNSWTKKEDRLLISEPCKEKMSFEPRGSSSIYRAKVLSALDISLEEDNTDFQSLDLLIEDIIDDEKGVIGDAILKLEPYDNNYSAKIRRRASEIGISYEKAHNYIIDKLNQRLDDDSVISEEEVVNKDQQKNLFKDELDFFKTRQSVHQHNFDINFESTKDGKKFTNLLFSHIAKIRRLREIRVLTAFTRGRGVQEIKVDIKGDKNWLPAIEAFGEGIYFELNKDTITKYFTENREKFAELIKGQQHELNKLKDNFFLDIPDSALFILTHSLSHLLIRQLTFNSGYSSSALRERIFVDPDSNYAGIMIYTSELDAEGTMGGLVDQARIDVIDLVLEKITESAIWCSADPVCRETRSQGFSGLNRSACHCCSLVAETSCTFLNAMLNRLTLGGLGKDRDEVTGILTYIRELV